jgi:uncharacterized protein (TIGR03435 family)
VASKLTRFLYLAPLAILLPVLGGAVAQTTSGNSPVFDVGSVKVLGRIVPGQKYGDLSTPGRVFYRTTLRHMVKIAWSAEPEPSSEPNWFGSEMYELQAKAPEGSSKEQIPMMLQAFLQERFGLRVHKESRQVPVYELGLRSATPRVTSAEIVEPGSASGSTTSGSIVLKRATMDQFASYLTKAAGRPVVNRTGLSGVFAVSLRWTPEMAPAAAARSEFESTDFFTALRELGFSLKTATGTFDYVVIEHAERMPREN